MEAAVPKVIRTSRLLLRPYEEADAELLRPILADSGTYLSDWLPPHVWEVVPIETLRERLSNYADLFMQNVEWRYGAFSLDGRELLGSVGLFLRNGSGRVPFGQADRAEVGYWIRKDRSGEGLATEGTVAMIDVARRLPGIAQIEIRCSVRNAASSAIPRRLGFHLADPAAEDDLQVWVTNA